MVFLGGAGWAAPRSFSPIPIVRRQEAIFRKRRGGFGGPHDLVISHEQARAGTPALQPARRPTLHSYNYQITRSRYLLQKQRRREGGDTQRRRELPIPVQYPFLRDTTQPPLLRQAPRLGPRLGHRPEP